MATRTPNYDLIKPSYTESVDVAVINENMDSLDTILDNKMNKPLNNGAIDQILRHDGNGHAVWGNPATGTEVAEAVTEWLDENIIDTQGVALDDSLTVQHAAADAKAAGNVVVASTTQPNIPANKLWIKDSSEAEYTVPTYDEFSDLKSAINIFNPYLFPEYYPSTLTTGYAIKSADGKLTTLNSFSYSDFFKVVPGSKIRLKNYAAGVSDYVGLAFYTKSNQNNFISGSGVAYTSIDGIETVVPDTAKYCRVTVHNNKKDAFSFGYEVEKWIETIEAGTATATEKTAIIGMGKNLFDKSKITTGKYLNGSGAMQSGSGYNVSDYIPIEAGKTYQIGNNWNAWIYNSSKTALHNVPTKNCYTAVSGDAFMMITVQDANLSIAQVEESAFPTKYQDYGYKIGIKDIAFDEVSKDPDNMFNQNVVTKGCLDGSTGAVISTTGDLYVTSFLAVESDEIYTVSGMWGSLCLYLADGTFSRSVTTIISEDNLKVVTFKPTATEAFARFTVEPVNYGKCKFEKNIGYSKHTGNVSGIVAVESIAGEIEKITHVYVGTDCYFATINAANNAISGNNKQNRFVIHILKGTYNETFRTKDYVDYVGDNKYQSIVNYISDNESDWANRSTIFAETNSRIANLTVRTTGSKYPIHADANYGLPYTVTIEDCIIAHDGYSDTSINPGGTGIGIGLHFYQNVIIKRCIISATPNVNGLAAIYCHNDDQNNTQEYSLRSRSLTIEDCILKDSYYGLRLQAIETVDGQDNTWNYIGNINTCTNPVYYESGTYNSWHYFGMMNDPEYVPGN